MDGTTDILEQTDAQPPLTLDDAPVAPTVEQPLRKETDGSSNLSGGSIFTDALEGLNTKTCGTCGKQKIKSLFAKAADWPAPDSPLCQKCRNASREGRRDIVLTGGAAQRELQKFTTQELIQRHDDVLGRALEGITQRKINDASAKDLAIVAKNILMNKQLLEEKPTQIVGHAERESLLEMANLIRLERERRAKTIEATAKVVS